MPGRKGSSEHRMLPVPTKYALAAGAAEGETPLNAFDNALLAAGIGNLNLVRVSSIVPPGARRVDYVDLPPGALAPTAYGAVTSQQPGELIA
ncbi:MAG TPA: pyruvoyl-dependent arginine decarboxylase, partial [Limnochordales bacterium]